MSAIAVEWYEVTYPRGRMGDEIQPQFVGYMICPPANDLAPAAEVFESLVGLGGFVLVRNHYLSDRQFSSWHQTLDEAYEAAYRWVSRRVSEVGDCRDTDCEHDELWWTAHRLMPDTRTSIRDRSWWHEAIEVYALDQRRKHLGRSNSGEIHRQYREVRGLGAPISVRAWVGGECS